MKIPPLLAALPFAAWTAVAALATRPRLAARVFGESTTEPRDPLDFGMLADDVAYVPGSKAWWIPSSEPPVGAVVIVHGFEPTDDPRSTDPGPRLDLAARLQRHGVASLVINLGYASGAHLHSGGPLEAADIAAAVDWARERSGVPVAIVGFSAGGHASVVASTLCASAAVVTDSAFVDFGEVVADQASQLLRLPAVAFGPVPYVMRAMTGEQPADLEAMELSRETPMLHIHGDADTAIHYSNLGRLAAVTSGATVTVEGADHLDGLRREPDRYEATVVAFLLDAFGQAEALSAAHTL